MFSKRRYRRRNKPSHQNILDGGEQQADKTFIPPVQTKLTVGRSGDKYEREADRTADEVVNKSNDTPILQKQESEEEEVQAKPLVEGITPFIQKQSEEEEEAVQAQVEEEEEEEAIQAQNEEEEEEEVIQPKSDEDARNPSLIADELKRDTGQGNPLDKKTKMEMEQKFGNDFSDVRIHTSDKAKKMNQQIHAQAFTHGQDIYFNQSKYDPHTKQGKHLLAHELTHTIQQRGPNKASHNGLSKAKSGSIQKEEIRYRSITWNDFEAEASPMAHHSAAVAAGIGLTLGDERISMGWQEAAEGQITVTISYNSDAVALHAFMDTAQSWKALWLTDDEAARAKLGPDANIAQARSSLLSHEQIHFLNAQTIAQLHDPLAKAAVPTSDHTETFTAHSPEEIQIGSQEILTRKGNELDEAISAIRVSAQEELDSIQAIYDVDTEHSTNEQNQTNWRENYDETFEEARERATAPEEEADQEAE